jgi:hypothetical protein
MLPHLDPAPPAASSSPRSLAAFRTSTAMRFHGGGHRSAVSRSQGRGWVRFVIVVPVWIVGCVPEGMSVWVPVGGQTDTDSLCLVLVDSHSSRMCMSRSPLPERLGEQGTLSRSRPWSSL